MYLAPPLFIEYENGVAVRASYLLGPTVFAVVFSVTIDAERHAL